MRKGPLQLIEDRVVSLIGWVTNQIRRKRNFLKKGKIEIGVFGTLLTREVTNSTLTILTWNDLKCQRNYLCGQGSKKDLEARLKKSGRARGKTFALPGF